jgi:hypothetical protein
MSVGGCASLEKKPAKDLATQSSAALGEASGDKPEDDTWRSVWEMLDLGKAAEKIKIGKAVDFEKDGRSARHWVHSKEHRQWTDEKGAHHLEAKGPPNNPYCYALEIRPDGTKALSYDATGNGKFSKIMEERPDSNVYLIDRKGNGTFDERVTLTFYESDSILGWWSETDYVFEKRKPDGTWEITRSTKGGSHSHRSFIDNGAW